MKNHTIDKLLKKLQTDPKWKEVMRRIEDDNNTSLEALVPANSVARVILERALRSKNISNTIFSEIFKVLSKIWSDVNRENAAALFANFRDCVYMQDTLKIRKAGKAIVDNIHNCIDAIGEAFLCDAEIYDEYARLCRMCRFNKLKDCHEKVDIGDKAVPEMIVQLMLDEWTEAREFASAPALAAALADLYVMPDDPENLHAALVSLGTAARIWHFSMPGAADPESPKDLT